MTCQNTLNSTFNNNSASDSYFANARFISAANLKPSLQKIIALLWLDLISSGTNGDMCNWVDTLPSLVDEPNDYRYNAVIPDNL